MSDNRVGVDQSKYPAGQAPRGPGQAEIKAQVFREKDAAAKARSEPEKPE